MLFPGVSVTAFDAIVMSIEIELAVLVTLWSCQAHRWITEAAMTTLMKAIVEEATSK